MAGGAAAVEAGRRGSKTILAPLPDLLYPTCPLAYYGMRTLQQRI